MIKIKRRRHKNINPWRTEMLSAQEVFVLMWLPVAGVVAYILFRLRAVTRYGLDIDTVFLLELPRTNSEDWFRTFATSAHPFGVLVQHLYVDLLGFFGVPDFMAWKLAIGAGLLIQAAFILRSFNTTALLSFLCSLVIFPSLWRNILSLEEEILGMTLFLISACLLINRPFGSGKIDEFGGIGRSKGDQGLVHPSSVILVSAASLWHFQYWFILSIALLCLALRAMLKHAEQRKALLVWSVATTSYLPLFHLFGIVRSTPYHQQWPSLPSHLAAGNSITDWLGWLARCFFWHGEPYIGDGALSFALVALLGLLILGIFFSSRKNDGETKARLSFLLVSSLLLPVLYEPTSSERWLPFWTMVLICGMMSLGSNRGTWRVPTCSDSAFNREILGCSKNNKDLVRNELSDIQIIALLAHFSFAILSAVTWHDNFSVSHLSNWSAILSWERCSEDAFTMNVAPLLDDETLVFVGRACGSAGNSTS